MSWSIQMFRLVAEPGGPGLFCGSGGLTLGGVPLLAMAGAGWEPLSVDRLQRIFDAAYGPNSGIDAQSRLKRLESVAHALDASDLCRATIESLMLRLPDIDPTAMSDLTRIETARASKYDEDEPRDRRGRWTTEGAESPSATSKRPETSASSGQGPRPRTVRSSGRRPGTHDGNPNIIPVQSVLRALPLFPPFSSAAGHPKPKDDDDYLFPPSLPMPGAKHPANDNTDADTHASANDKQPKACPDPSYEPSSVSRTPQQLRYQAQITGLPLGYHVLLDGIGYDGCRTSDQYMLEAKHTSPWFLYLPEDEIRKLNEYHETIDQATEQDHFSGGRGVEWHFSDPGLAYFWRKEFASHGLLNTTVIYTPYDEYYNYNIGKSRKFSF